MKSAKDAARSLPGVGEGASNSGEKTGPKREYYLVNTIQWIVSEKICNLHYQTPSDTELFNQKNSNVVD